MSEFKNIVIVGCGLIGGSFALALRRAGYSGRITAYGGRRSPKIALERDVVNDIEKSFDRGEVCDADLVYLAAPIGGIIDFLRTRSSQIKRGALVTDAGSTKTDICRVAKESIPEGVHFIGGHPMAGSEQTGVEYARADLFDRATYVLIRGGDGSRLSSLKSTIEGIGARVILTEPVAHDQAVALVSHLPQLVASSLAALHLAVEDSDLAQRMAATGWLDMTRLAGSSWKIWRDIILTNQTNISDRLGLLIAELQSLKDALDARDLNRARELFEEANHAIAAQRSMRYRGFEKL
ncbi:MAG: prephenate dehydrogenase/arogenate dehydrogenase family protein [Acidobacteria bacterium]|nr:prephenate dehydrogenase/arogenate dehydrogenase family protein [Acidobacteriota bacterium]